MYLFNITIFSLFMITNIGHMINRKDSVVVNGYELNMSVDLICIDVSCDGGNLNVKL